MLAVKGYKWLFIPCVKIIYRVYNLSIKNVCKTVSSKPLLKLFHLGLFNVVQILGVTCISFFSSPEPKAHR